MPQTDTYGVHSFGLDIVNIVYGEDSTGHLSRPRTNYRAGNRRSEKSVGGLRQLRTLPSRSREEPPKVDTNSDLRHLTHFAKSPSIALEALTGDTGVSV
jgi:hypothetical protein